MEAVAPKMKFSEYQFNIFEAVKTTQDNICVQATAGSGKTTTLLEILNIIPKFKKTIFLSFSNTIVNELKSRIPAHTTASTLHSLGCRMIFATKKGVRIDNDKWFKIFLNTFPKEELKIKATFKMCYEMVDIINYARMTLTKFNDEDLELMCQHYNVNYTKEHFNKVISEFNKDRKLTSIDFTDMIYLPIKLNLADPIYDYVLLDEAQDLNNAQRIFVERILKPQGRLLAVGDEKQSIYSFSGSSVDSFSKLQERPNTTTLPLSISYRCAKNIVRKAQEIYPDSIQYFEGAVDGEVRKGTIDEAQVGDLIICRKTAPLIEAFFHLLKNRIKAQVIGRDIETGLVNLAEKVQTSSIENTLLRMQDELDAIIEQLTRERISKPTLHPKYVSLEEKCEVIKVILSHIDSSSMLVSTIKEIFAESKTSLKLMTIHRSKGLEADRVFLIEKYDGKAMYPSPRAVQSWEKVQEANLQFVAITRAKKQLIQLSI
jgi:DNA helicase-2/ATP-dependent DNA helicase PcrA